MIESSIARRYARALLEIGKETGKTDAFLSELTSFDKSCLDHGQLLSVLGNRFLPVGSRLQILGTIAQKLSLSVTVANFLRLLLRKSRMALLPQVTEIYRAFVFKLQNRVEVKVTSAKALSAEVLKQLEEVLARKTGKGIVLESAIRPEVLGGLSVEVEGMIYDGTILSQLNGMELEMKKTVFA